MPSSPSTVKMPARSASISSATKAIMSAGVSELTVTRMARPRRRCFSAVS